MPGMMFGAIASKRVELVGAKAPPLSARVARIDRIEGVWRPSGNEGSFRTTYDATRMFGVLISGSGTPARPAPRPSASTTPGRPNGTIEGARSTAWRADLEMREIAVGTTRATETRTWRAQRAAN